MLRARCHQSGGCVLIWGARAPARAVSDALVADIGGLGSARALHPAREGARAYSPSKVIHRWRGGLSFPPPQPTVKNFGGGEKMTCQQLHFLLNRRVEHAGPGRRIVRSNAATFKGRRSLRGPAPCRQGTLRTFRLQVQTGQRRTSISASIRQGRRAQHQPQL